MKTFIKVCIVFFIVIGLQAPVFNAHISVSAQEESTSNESSSTEENSSAPKEEKSDKGIDGQDGDSGESGSDGEDGQDGSPQEQEPAEDGDNGEAGESGENGDSGQAGDNGEDGTGQENGEDGGDATNGENGTEGEDGGNGTEGENGNSAGETSNGGEGDTEINTGDASSAGQINNTGNSNSINSCQKADKTEGKGDKESKEEQEEGAQEEECVSGGSGDAEIENNNDAQVGNDAGIEASTGENEANENNGSGTIETGDAEAVLDLFNLLNTNIIDSNGLFVLLSNLQEQILDLDIRDWMPYLQEYNPECGESCYSLKDLEILNQNLAEITNNINVTANTGGNQASGNAGNATIETGNAYAAANVINIANTNIIDSNYLLFIANNFGNYFGDIVFPNASSFFSSMFASPSQVYSEVDVNNNNTASISNNVGASAETGNNGANGNGSSVIQTGDAHSAANVFNQANMNLFGTNSFVALIRVSGDWSGNVFGLPEGISWQQTPSGIMLYSDDLAFGSQVGSEGSGSCQDCGASGKSGGKGSKAEHSELSINNTNNATINNNVQVFALTGDNETNGNGKQAKIETGNAQAVANVVNVANTNVIGSNWLFAMFNILGDFNGNISFGRPNLWVGQRAEIPNDPARPGDPLTYYFTVVNNGDVPASNVQLKSVFDHPLFAFGSSSDEHTQPEESEFLWNLGTIYPGEGLEISLSGTIVPDLPFGTYAFTNTTSAQADEGDDNQQDNSDSVELVVVHEQPTPSGGGGGGSGGGGSSGGGSGGGSGGSNSGNASTSSTEGTQGETGQPTGPNLTVIKTHNAPETIYPGDSVDYTIVVSNMNGTSAYEAVLVDVLEDEEGNVIHEEEWDLGEVFPDEEITITYSVIFEQDAKSGLYYNDAWVDASNGYSNVATTELYLENIQEFLLSVDKKVSKIKEQLGLEETRLAVPEEDVEIATREPQQQISDAVVNKQQNPFLASLGGLLQGFGPWLSAVVAASLLLLFFLLKRRRQRAAQ